MQKLQLYHQWIKIYTNHSEIHQVFDDQIIHPELCANDDIVVEGKKIDIYEFFAMNKDDEEEISVYDEEETETKSDFDDDDDDDNPDEVIVETLANNNKKPRKSKKSTNQNKS